MLRTKPMGPCILGEHSTKWATWLHHSIHLWRKSQMFDRDLQGSFKYLIMFSLRFLWHLRWFCSPHLKTTVWNVHCSLSPHVKRHTHTHESASTDPSLGFQGKHMIGFLRASGHYVFIYQSMCHMVLKVPYIVSIVLHFHWMRWTSAELRVNKAYVAQTIRPSQLSRDEKFPPDLSHMRCRCLEQSEQSLYSPPESTGLSKVSCWIDHRKHPLGSARAETWLQSLAFFISYGIHLGWPNFLQLCTQMLAWY